uniref:Uncharacterized protein n=1 Tax=Rhizophora mucronata TaxID=61149 RepID=A0A2P2JYD6_RHIMU
MNQNGTVGQTKVNLLKLKKRAINSASESP